ncbi:MAG: hypothetical protein ACT4PP_07070 [Sporichthyaceae bacterium]
MSEVLEPQVSERGPVIWDADATGEFPAPGTGTWGLDASHSPHPMCRFAAPLLRPGFQAGFGSTFARYGGLLDHVDMIPVRGFLYNQVRVLGAPPEANEHPPREVFAHILATSPAHQERLAAAEAVWADRIWRTDLAYWDEEHKPRLHALRDELDSVALAELNDTDLVDHVRRCAKAFVEGWVVHHTYNGAALIAVGDFMVHALGWTGRSPGELLGALAGTSPVSEGGGAELTALAQAVVADPVATALVTDAGGDAARILAGLTSCGAAVAQALAAYLNVARYLPIDGEDSVGAPTTTEAPQLVLGRIRGRVGCPGLGTCHAGCGCADRRHPRRRARGVPGGVRRPARRGPVDVPDPRRAGRAWRSRLRHGCSPRPPGGRTPLGCPRQARCR